jgi:hypothetical protein
MAEPSAYAYDPFISHAQADQAWVNGSGCLHSDYPRSILSLWQSWSARHNMTREEWDRYLPGQEYHKTCEQWPEGK